MFLFLKSYASFIHVTLPGRRKKGPKQGVHKEALPQGEYTFHSLFTQKGLLFHAASSLKPLSHVYSTPITSPFVDELAMNVKNPCLYVISPT